MSLYAHATYLTATFFLVAAQTCRGDTVALLNGDRLTGEIRMMEQSRLVLRTEWAGDIRIDWKAIASIATGRPYRVEAESGAKFIGVIRPAPAGIEVVSSPTAVVFAPHAVKSINEIQTGTGLSFWRHVEGTGELGYSLAKGNSALNQSSLALDARYPAEKYKIDFTLTSLFSRQAGAPATRYHTASVRYDRFLSPRSFAFALTRFERDDRQLLNLRRNLGGGLGWHFLTSDRSDLSLFGGFTFIHESFREGEAPAEGRRGPSSGEGLLRLDLEKTMLGPVQFSTTLSIHPNVTEPGRYRLSLESGLRVPGVSRFTWGLRLFDRFDSEPPIRVERNDYGLISSVGVTF